MSQSKGVALVTGSAQGIGRAIAIKLAQDGFDVALSDIPSKTAELHDLAAEIERGGDSEGAYHPKSCIVAADVSNEDEVKHMIDTVVDVLGGLDVMVANAGIVTAGDILTETLENWERVMKTNATSVFLCYKYAALQMVKQGRGGRIIGASSEVGKQATPSVMSYSVSKFAIRGLTQAVVRILGKVVADDDLALQLGRHGITVNSYAPGVIQTPILAAAEFSKAVQKVLDSSAVGHIGQPEDVAHTVSYLASKGAHFVTGQSLSVDGGYVLS